MGPALSEHLLLQVAEQLKTPLLQIARQSELQTLGGPASSPSVQSIAESALGLIDNYSLGIRLALQGNDLQSEAVSVSSVLYDAGQELYGFARDYGVTLELDVAGRYGPVMAHRAGLQAALVSLGAGLIEALPALETNQPRLRIATHRSRYGIVAGIYGDAEQIGHKVLGQGRRLFGHSRQPLPGLTHGSGAGILVADALLQTMKLDLKATRHRRLYGLGTVLQPNPQLQLV